MQSFRETKGWDTRLDRAPDIVLTNEAYPSTLHCTEGGRKQPTPTGNHTGYLQNEANI